jgi:hypothetical protein
VQVLIYMIAFFATTTTGPRTVISASPGDLIVIGFVILVVGFFTRNVWKTGSVLARKYPNVARFQKSMEFGWVVLGALLVLLGVVAFLSQ